MADVVVDGWLYRRTENGVVRIMLAPDVRCAFTGNYDHRGCKIYRVRALQYEAREIPA